MWQTDHSSGLQLVLARHLHTAYYGFYGNPYCQCCTALESVKIMFISELVNIMNGERKIVPGINILSDPVFPIFEPILLFSIQRHSRYIEEPGSGVSKLR